MTRFPGDIRAYLFLAAIGAVGVGVWKVVEWLW